jgi:hypothetical protein
MHEHLEDPAIVRGLKTHFAPDGAAEREHNAHSATLGFGAIHYSLVINLKPRRLLVIGSRHGYIPATMAIGLRVLGAGSLDCSSSPAATPPTIMSISTAITAMRDVDSISRRP